MPTTSNFGWTTPADTDLVKDGAAAIRTLGNGVDSSFVDLKGGTTGQILSKASNTDLDFTWTAGGDLTEIQAGVGISVASGTGPIPVITNSSTDLITTAGDLLYGTAADTVARLGIGTAGQVLTVNSGATAPQWSSAGGGYTLLETGSLTGASVTTGSLSQSYTDLYVVIRDWYPATDAARLRLRVNGVSAANSYQQGINAGSAVTQAFDSDYIGLTIDTDNTVHKNLVTIRIPDYTNTVSWKLLASDAITANSTTSTSVSIYVGILAITSAITAVSTLTFLTSSGNHSGGTYYVYGVK